MTDAEAEGRLWVILGATLAQDEDALDTLTEEMAKPELVALVEALARLVVKRLTQLAPAERIAPMLSERAIQAALEGPDHEELAPEFISPDGRAAPRGRTESGRHCRS